jgi:hypothetical protein
MLYKRTKAYKKYSVSPNDLCGVCFAGDVDKVAGVHTLAAAAAAVTARYVGNSLAQLVHLGAKHDVQFCRNKH